MKNFLKKLFTILGLVGIVSTNLAILNPSQTAAINIDVHSNCDEFLGISPWDCGIESDINSEESLKSNIWKIAVNIAKDIAVIAAYLVIGYVIYGGYQYVFSGGDPGKVATGKKTLTQAFIGLAIVMSANLIMSTIRYALIKDSDFGCIQSTEGGKLSSTCPGAGVIVVNTIQWFIAIAGIVSAIFVVYGGISYATSAGDPGKLQKAKSMITYALIGLAIVALAEIITAFVSNMIREANNSATSINQNILISKEVNENKIN